MKILNRSQGVTLSGIGVAYADHLKRRYRYRRAVRQVHLARPGTALCARHEPADTRFLHPKRNAFVLPYVLSVRPRTRHSRAIIGRGLSHETISCPCGGK